MTEHSPEQIKSSAIRRAAEIAIAAGNAITEMETGWVKMREVVVMKLPLTQETRDKIRTELSLLRYVTVDRTPFLRAEERFLSDDDKAAISFPQT